MTITDSACGITGGTGHDGSGGDAEGSCKLLDFGSGRADVYSSIFDPRGLTEVGYDFIYRADPQSMWFSCDMTPGTGTNGPYLNWDGGYVLYLNSNGTAWNYVRTNWGADYFRWNSNLWQRVQVFKDSATTAKLEITDMVSGSKQISDPFAFSSLVPNDQMRWMTNNSNGNYRLIYDLDNVYTRHTTVQISGDANGDGNVDVGDLGILSAHYGATSGATRSMGDFNGDGAVDVGDLGILSSNYGYSATPIMGQKFIRQAYALIFHENGQVDVYDRRSGKDVFLGTVGAFSFPGGGMQSTGSTATISTSPGTCWPQVIVNYQIAQGSLSACWTLMPEMAHVQFTVSPAAGYTLGEGPSTLGFTTSNPTQLVKEIKPACWYPHPNGGVPFQLTEGMANQYSVGNMSLILANDCGRTSLYDAGKINLYVRQKQNQFRANAVISMSNSSLALPLAVAAAGDDQLMLNVKSPQPFYLWENMNEPIVLEVGVTNLSPHQQSVDLDYIAHDYDGQVVGQGHISAPLGPLAVWQTPLQLTVSNTGPIWVEVKAQHSQSSVVQNLCLGIMPNRSFPDGLSSRFGISAYRGNVGPHTELRTETQLLGLMSKIGVRGLRMSNDSNLAHQMGFYTWYQNNISGSAAYDYFAGRPSWIDVSANRDQFSQGNLQHVINQGDSVFEFTNEWNLYGGAESGVLADRYARDWAIPLKAIRDQICPQVKLAGCVIANGDLTYLSRVYNAGGWNAFDILAFHAIGVPDSCDFDNGNTYWSYLATLRRVYTAMKQYGEKELWMTEFYAPTAPNNSMSNNERVSAEEITLQCALAVAADVRGFMLYCLDDFDDSEEIKTASQVGEPMEREYYFGLVRRDWTPKAGLWAYQTAAYYFDGARFIGDISMPAPDLFGMVFEGRNGRFAVLWSRKEGYLGHSSYHPIQALHKQPWEEFWTLRTPFTFAANSGVTVVNCVGQSRTITPVNGNVTIELTGAPIYVVGGNFSTCAGKFSTLFQ
jgi:hypothetical protein